MSTRAKFECTKVDEYKNQGAVIGQNVTLMPVYGDTEENKAFWEATPSGSIQMYISNPGAFGKFKQGSRYYVDFIQAE